jgi:hypothetical protein
MKFYLFIPIAILIFLNGLICNATTLIVDSHYPRPAGVYATIQLAYDAASAGDTILLSPSESVYTGIAIDKKIHIVGTGWTDPTTNVPHTKTGGFTFNAGAQGSSISGLETSTFDINTDSITVKRNKCYWIGVRENCSNVVIIQNYIIGALESYTDRVWQTMIYVWINSEVYISNNIIYNQSNYYRTNYAIVVCFPSNTVISNNVLRGDDYSIVLDMSEGYYSTHSVSNNIIISGSISGIATSNNNICNSTQFAATNGNQPNIVMTDVFIDPATYNFHLKEGSPAIGAGFGGTDCGIYGGKHPFVDNGRTWLPIITEMTVPTEVNVIDGLDVTIKAKSGK